MLIFPRAIAKNLVGLSKISRSGLIADDNFQQTPWTVMIHPLVIKGLNHLTMLETPRKRMILNLVIDEYISTCIFLSNPIRTPDLEFWHLQLDY